MKIPIDIKTIGLVYSSLIAIAALLSSIFNHIYKYYGDLRIDSKISGTNKIKSIPFVFSSKNEFTSDPSII
jgi:hypothetical protein